MRLNFYTDDYDVTASQSGTTNKSITVSYNCVTNCNKTVTISQSDQIYSAWWVAYIIKYSICMEPEFYRDTETKDF